MKAASNKTECARLGHLARWSILILGFAGIFSSSALATTESETILSHSPLPHERLATGGGLVKVHWVRLQGYFEGANGHAAMMDDLKAQVQSCVLAAGRAGRQARPPRIWPDYVSINQKDAYDSPNRSISYDTTLLYTVNPSDCSLSENYKRMATLTSSRGICEIDLADKSANGFCDAKAQSDAPPLIRAGARTQNGSVALQHVANRAAMEALEKAMKLTPGKTGERKRILGIECDVWKSPFDPNGTACLSRGGSFVAAHATTGSADSSMELEIMSTIGVNLRATRAELDGKVNAAVFAPYLADGFKVSNIGGRK